MPPNSVIREDCEALVSESRDYLAHLEGSSILVTGANGFLCSYLVDAIAHCNDELFAEPCTIHAFDNLAVGERGRLSHLDGRSDVHFHVHDITTPLDLDEPIDWIVHGASIASPTFYRRYPLPTLDANINGTRQMLDLAMTQSARGIAVMSSSEIYGNPPPDQIPTKEDYWGNVSCVGPRACYDESKRVAETLCWIYRSHHLVPVKVLRPFNVYGPGQRLDDARIIPDLMRAAIEGRPFTLLSEGADTRTFCYVRDAVNGIIRVLVSAETDGMAFNLGSNDGEISIRDLAGVFCEVAERVTGKHDHIVEFAQSEDLSYLVNNPQRRSPDITLIQNTVGYHPAVPLREGLERTLCSYINNYA